MRNKALNRREFLKLAATAGLLAGCDRLLPSKPPSPPPNADLFALTNGTLIDGTGSDPLTNATVVMREDRIVDVGQFGVADLRHIDVKGATILPGFINAHVHGGYDQATLQAWAQGRVTPILTMER